MILRSNSLMFSETMLSFVCFFIWFTYPQHVYRWLYSLVFPFILLSICMFARTCTSFSEVPEIYDKVLVKVSQVVYIIVATYQKALVYLEDWYLHHNFGHSVPAP